VADPQLERFVHRWTQKVYRDVLDDDGMRVLGQDGKPEFETFEEDRFVQSYRELLTGRDPDWLGLPRGDLGLVAPWVQQAVDLRSVAPLGFPLRLGQHVRQDSRWPDQRRCVAAWIRQGSGLLIGQTGAGKALANGEPVVTNKGLCPVAKIREGDMVAGVDGHFYPVSGVFPQGKRQLYRVWFTGGDYVDTDADHLWALDKRHDGNKRVVVTTGELRQGSLMRNRMGRRFFLPTVEPLCLPYKDLPVDPYTLGVLLGDGSLSVPSRVYLTTADAEILKLIQLPPKHRPKNIKDQNCGAATTYRLATKYKYAWGKEKVVLLRELLDDLQLMGTTSHTKFIPQEYLLSSEEQRLALLQGLMDTNGTDCRGVAGEYCSASKKLMDGVVFLVSSLGGTASQSEKVTRLGGREFLSYRAYVKLPQHLPLFRLSRKLACRKKQRQREPYRAVDRIEPIGEGEATCISVEEAPGNLFLTRNCIPTHNTVLGVAATCRLGLQTLIVSKRGEGERHWEREFRQHTNISQLEKQLGRRLIGPYKHKGGYPISIVTVQTFLHETGYRRLLQDQFRFGLVIADEIHELVAPQFIRVFGLWAPLCWLGLTATLERPDHREFLAKQILGPVAATMKADQMRPKVEFIETQFWTPHWMLGRVPYSPEFMWGKVLGLMIDREDRNALIIDRVVQDLNNGRLVAVVGQRKRLLRKIHQQLTSMSYDVAYADGDVPTWRRDKIYAEVAKRVKYQGIVAGKVLDAMVSIKPLDCMHIITPLSKKHQVMQVFGRARRPLKGKPIPLIRYYVDKGGQLQGAAKNVVKFCNDEGWEIKHTAAALSKRTVMSRWRKR